VVTESFILKKGERAYAEFPVFETSQEDLRKLPGDDSLSGGFKLTRGIHYGVGQKKSELMQRSALTETSDGYLVITDKNLIFSGASGFSFEISGLIGLRIFSDSIQFSTINNSAQRTIGFFDPLAVEYCGVVLSRVINQ
jgi:hypothetical protein